MCVHTKSSRVLVFILHPAVKLLFKLLKNLLRSFIDGSGLLHQPFLLFVLLDTCLGMLISLVASVVYHLTVSVEVRETAVPVVGTSPSCIVPDKVRLVFENSVVVSENGLIMTLSDDFIPGCDRIGVAGSQELFEGLHGALGLFVGF